MEQVYTHDTYDGNLVLACSGVNGIAQVEFK
jgi:hypothetical protein